MNTSLENPQVVPPHLGQNKLIGFLESLHRIIKIGIYYPAGHKVLDQAAEKFQRNIEEVADTNRSVRIELQDEILLVEGYGIAKLTNALQEFKKIILDLGIGAIEIDRSIPLTDLLQFVRSLLLGRSKIQGIKEFTQAEIANLPASVRVWQKEFLIDESTASLGSNEDNSKNGLDTVFQILAEQGLDRERIKQCKKFLIDLSDRFSRKSLNVKGLPSITWNEVQSLLLKVVTNASRLSGSPAGVFVQNELNTLSAIFQGLEQETIDRESREAINFLVSAFDGGSFRKPVAPGPESSIHPADNVAAQSVEQLQAFVENNAVHPGTLTKINQIDRREELTILLQLLQLEQVPSIEEKIRQNLRNILTSQLNDREIDILTKGLVHLATHTESSRFSYVMGFLTIISRSAKNFSSQQFLLMICRHLSSAVQKLLWPILVNEILISGRTMDRKVFDRLVNIATQLSGSEMKDRWPELEAMDCFQDKKIATDIFDPAQENCFPLFSFLLETSMKRAIGARILSSFTANPSDWLIESVAPLLQPSIPQHLKFLQIYLLLAHQKNFTVNLRVAAGTLVVQHLPELSEQQMTQPWVAKTIQATPEIQVEGTRALLEGIIEEKRMFIVPKWPKDCRRAAAEALGKLRRRPL